MNATVMQPMPDDANYRVRLMKQTDMRILLSPSGLLCVMDIRYSYNDK